MLAVGLLKVDVEGKDLAVLRSVLDYCDSTSNAHGGTQRGTRCPLAIQFESLEGYESDEARASLLKRLSGPRADGGVGLYHMPTHSEDDYAKLSYHDIYLSRTSLSGIQGEDTTRPLSMFAWSGPLALVVDGSVACEGAEAEGAFQGDAATMTYPQAVHPFAAGVSILACLVSAR